MQCDRLMYIVFLTEGCGEMDDYISVVMLVLVVAVQENTVCSWRISTRGNERIWEEKQQEPRMLEVKAVFQCCCFSLLIKILSIIII